MIGLVDNFDNPKPAGIVIPWYYVNGFVDPKQTDTFDVTLPKKQFPKNAVGFRNASMLIQFEFEDLKYNIVSCSEAVIRHETNRIGEYTFYSGRGNEKEKIRRIFSNFPPYNEPCESSTSTIDYYRGFLSKYWWLSFVLAGVLLLIGFIVKKILQSQMPQA